MLHRTQGRLSISRLSPQRTWQRRSLPLPRASFLQGLLARKPKQPPEVQELLALVQGTDRGLNTSPSERKAILDLICKLEEAGDGRNNTSPQLLSGTWRQLWGTEKESQFIIKNSWLFGTKAGPVYQVGVHCEYCQDSPLWERGYKQAAFTLHAGD